MKTDKNGTMLYDGAPASVNRYGITTHGKLQLKDNGRWELCYEQERYDWVGGAFAWSPSHLETTVETHWMMNLKREEIEIV